MKKSMLLSFVTAGAIIATSVGTYAVWDQLDVSKYGDLTIDKPVTMTMENLTSFTSSRAADTLDSENAPSYTQDVTFDVNSMPDGAESKYKLNVNAKVYKDNSTTETVDGFSVEVSKATSDTNDKIEGSHTYTVKVTPTDNTLVDTNYDVKVTASIDPVTPAA